MPCSLVDLSTELQLNIVEELLRHTHVDNSKNADGESQEDPYNYNQEKPDERQKRKEREQKENRVQDLRNWSCTSQFFREFLAPYIFETITLRNNNKSGASVDALSKSRCSEHIKELNYIGSAPGDAHRDEPIWSDTVAILPDSVNTLLSDLKCFPNLDILSIEFTYRFYDYEEWDEGLDLCAEEESDEDVKAAEEQIAWRALMAKTYQALAQNQDLELKHLDIRQLGPKKVSTFSDPTLHSLLSKLTRFSLSIYGEDNGAGWKINKCAEYEILMSRLDEYFFNHLASVSQLVVKAPEEGPLGLEGMNHIPLGLKNGQAPCCRILELEYVFIGPELIEFLINHSKTLEVLYLHNCLASPSGLAENGIHWNEFFDSLHAANFLGLHELKISPSRVPLTSEECYGQNEDPTRVPEEVKKARLILNDDQNRRVFAYGSLDDKYGMVFEDEEENLAAFERGEDQASYDRLMSQVSATRRRRTER